tara:strand:+ start:77 stop:586 length:510 start_codon:yes stop_codon:yes gene_type:complete
MKKILFTITLSCLTIISFAQKKNKYAKDIKVSTDKFDGNTTWKSPSFGKGIAATTAEPVQFIKVKENNTITTYLSLTTHGSTLNMGKQGVIVLFTDGDKIEFPNAEIDTEVGPSSFWKYSAFVKINNEELNKFIDKDLDDFRLYIYNSYISKKKKKKIRGWAQAIKEVN